MKSELMSDDAALDVRDACLERHVTEFTQSLFSEHSDRSDLRWLMAHFEIISAVSSYCGQNAFSAGEVTHWKTRALELFDADERRNDSAVDWRRKISNAFDSLISELSQKET